MAAMTRRIRFVGVVRGGEYDLEVECRGSAIETRVLDRAPQYSAFQIDRLSRPIADGDYIVYALGQSAPVRRVNGDWLAPLG